jgi:hypothetical protein
MVEQTVEKIEQTTDDHNDTLRIYIVRRTN